MHELLAPGSLVLSRCQTRLEHSSACPDLSYRPSCISWMKIRRFHPSRGFMHAEAVDNGEYHTSRGNY